MSEDNNLEIDESNRMAHHEGIKNEVRAEVQAEVANQAGGLNDRQAAEVAVVGEQMKRKAIEEVATTENELERSKVMARISQIVDYIFYLIYGLIGLRIILDLLGANRASGFRNFIAAVSEPFLAPFQGLLSDPASGRFQFRLSYLFALIAYLLLHLAITGLLRLMAHRKTAV